MNRTRLDAESVRDAVLAASGTLDQVGYAIVLNGLRDVPFGNGVLNGDLRAGAGLFTNGSVQASSAFMPANAPTVRKAAVKP